MIKAVIFDRDGVILDSTEANVKAAVIAFREIGINIKKKEENWVIGRHPDDYKKLFLKKYKFSYKRFREIQLKKYKKMMKSACFFKKTVSLIRKLHKKKIILALATSSSTRGTLGILKKARLENIFRVMVTFDDCKKRKPNPEPYLKTAKKLRMAPKDCLVIEDSELGLEAAKKAGMKCIVIPNRTTKNQNFSKADLVVKSGDKITLDVIKSL